MNRLIAIALGLLALMAQAYAASPDYEEKVFKNEHVGKVRFSMPKEWRAYDRHHIRFGTTFISPEKKNLEEFEISVNDSEHLSFKWRTEQELRQFIEQQMQQYVGRSVEKKVTLKSKTGENTVIYATLTDSQPKPGEFTLITLGVARNKDTVFLIFQLTNNPALVDRLVNVVSSAKVQGK